MKALPIMLQKAIRAWQEDNKAKLLMGVPGIAARFRLPDGTIKEVTYEGLTLYYKHRQEKGRKKAES